MTIKFEISGWRLENGRSEKDTMAELELELDQATLRNADIENVKQLIIQLLDKLKT